MRKPDFYKTPFRKRSDIIAHILKLTNQRSYEGHPHPFCFNVKLYRLDLDFDHLLEIFRKDDPAYTHNEEWLKKAKERYDEIGTDTIYEWGVSDAQAHYVGHKSDGVPHNEGNTILWDGTEVDARYSFEGRSGGWLSLNKLLGYNFTSREEHIEDLLQEMPFSDLRKLHQIIVMLAHDTKGANDEVEYQAAFNFFYNGCSDIPQPDAVQLTLPLKE